MEAWTNRLGRKALRKLGERKRDIIYKTAKIIEEIARNGNAVVVVCVKLKPTLSSPFTQT